MDAFGLSEKYAINVMNKAFANNNNTLALTVLLIQDVTKIAFSAFHFKPNNLFLHQDATALVREETGGSGGRDRRGK